MSSDRITVVMEYVAPNAVQLRHIDGRTAFTTSTAVVKLLQEGGFFIVNKYPYSSPTFEICGYGYRDPHIRRRRYSIRRKDRVDDVGDQNRKRKDRPKISD